MWILACATFVNNSFHASSGQAKDSDHSIAAVGFIATESPVLGPPDESVLVPESGSLAMRSCPEYEKDSEATDMQCI